MKLSVASISGRYDAGSLTSFCREVASCPHTARAYVGEMFCSKRQFPIEAFKEAVGILADGGKQPVFSTTALPMGESDFESAAPYVECVEAVEVNNLGFVPWLKENFPERRMLAGPVCNLYNRHDLEIVRDWGCTGVSLHLDLMPEAIADLSGCGVMPAEVFLHGRPPLAFSWRCYTARFVGRQAKNCGLACRAEGALVFHNMEGEEGYVVDGPSVLPGQTVSGVGQARQYADAGAAFGRLWLEPGQVTPVASTYAALLAGDMTPEQVDEELARIVSGSIRQGPIAKRGLS